MTQNLIIIILLSFSVCSMLFAKPDLSVADEEEIQQAIDAYEERSWELGLAAGYGVRTNPLINSDDIPMYAVLNIAWFGDYFFFDNGDLGFTAFETDKMSINFITHINNEREIFEWLNNSQLGIQFAGTGVSNVLPPNSTTEESPDNIIESSEIITGNPDNITGSPNNNLDVDVEVPKRSLAVDGGLEIIYADDWGDIQLQVLGDISNNHKGVEVWASYAYPWRYGNWKLVPSVGVNWKSSRFLDYYYGVLDSEATINHPSYKASSGFNSFARLTASYRINDNWGVTAIAQYETLSRSIRRSPIVDQDSIETLFIGIMYNF